MTQEDKRRSAGPETIQSGNGGVSSTEREIHKVENRLQQASALYPSPELSVPQLGQRGLAFDRWYNIETSSSCCGCLTSTVRLIHFFLHTTSARTNTRPSDQANARKVTWGG